MAGDWAKLERRLPTPQKSRWVPILLWFLIPAFAISLFGNMRSLATTDDNIGHDEFVDRKIDTVYITKKTTIRDTIYMNQIVYQQIDVPSPTPLSQEEKQWLQKLKESKYEGRELIAIVDRIEAADQNINDAIAVEGSDLTHSGNFHLINYTKNIPSLWARSIIQHWNSRYSSQ